MRWNRGNRRWIVGALLLVAGIGLISYLAGLVAQAKLQRPLPAVWKKIESRWSARHPKVFRLASPLARAYVSLYDSKLPGISRAVPDPQVWTGRGADPTRTYSPPSYDQRGFPLASDRGARGTPAEVPRRTVRVSNPDELLRALKHAEAGDEIIVSPGTYPIRAKGLRVSGAGTARHPIVLRAERLGQVRLRLDTKEGFIVAEPFWVFENLDIEGVCDDDSRCEHGFHVVGRAHSVVIRNNRIHEFNAAIKVNGTGRGDRSNYPDGGLIEANSLYNLSERRTTNPVAPVDIVAADDWRVDGNLIADFAKGQGNRTSSGAFIKGNAHGGVLERNLVICALRVPLGDGTRVGLSLGDGGTGEAYCRGQRCDAESTRGVIRNNVVMHCSDVGIYLNRATDSLVAHNLLFNTWGIDARFPETTALVVNNVFTGRLAERDGGQADRRHNLVLKNPGRFADPGNADFSLSDAQWLVDRATRSSAVADDFCGRERPAQTTDPGPFEYSGNAPGCVVF